MRLLLSRFAYNYLQLMFHQLFGNRTDEAFCFRRQQELSTLENCTKFFAREHQTKIRFVSIKHHDEWLDRHRIAYAQYLNELRLNICDICKSFIKNLERKNFSIIPFNFNFPDYPPAPSNRSTRSLIFPFLKNSFTVATIVTPCSSIDQRWDRRGNIRT